MRRRLFLATVVLAGLAATQIGAQQAATMTPAEAAPFLGDWTLTLQGPNGPGTFNLSLKVENDKVVGEVGNEMMPTQVVSNVSLASKSLRVSYTFPWEGNSIDALITLTPAEEGKTNAQADFAGGAYTMTGTATKKEKAK